MKYQLVEETDKELFEQLCEEMLIDGWKLVGGVSGFCNGRDFVYLQAFCMERV